MIRRTGDYEVSLRTNMRDGPGTVRIEHFWQKHELKGKTRLCARLTLDPGTRIGFHDHVDEEEIFIIQSGQGRVQDGDELVDVGPGDTILTGDGAGHALECVGETPLVFVALIVQY